VALAIALSVASGRPFLGKYEVGVQGPVLFVQEENPQGMLQSWMRKLSASYGMLGDSDVRVKTAGHGALSKMSLEIDMPADVPLWMLDNWGFDLSVDEHWGLLQGYIEEIKPVLIILDPLDLVFGPIDLNSVGQLQPILRRIIKLRYAYNCGVMVVHHMHKQSQNTTGRRAGQRLLGSAALHGFVDSALYTSRLEAEDEGWSRVKIEPEFRAVQPQKPMELAWHFGQGTEAEFKIGGSQSEIGDKILELMGNRKRIAIPSLSRELGIRSEKMRRDVRNDARLRLVGSGKGTVQYVYRNAERNGSRNGSREE